MLEHSLNSPDSIKLHPFIHSINFPHYHPSLSQSPLRTTAMIQWLIIKRIYLVFVLVSEAALLNLWKFPVKRAIMVSFDILLLLPMRGLLGSPWGWGLDGGRTNHVIRVGTFRSHPWGERGAGDWVQSPTANDETNHAYAMSLHKSPKEEHDSICSFGESGHWERAWKLLLFAHILPCASLPFGGSSDIFFCN